MEKYEKQQHIITQSASQPKLFRIDAYMTRCNKGKGEPHNTEITKPDQKQQDPTLTINSSVIKEKTEFSLTQSQQTKPDKTKSTQTELKMKQKQTEEDK